MCRINFVCHGNICRSPMAEFLLKDLVAKKGQTANFVIKSSATSSEEYGNPVYPPVRRILSHLGIDCTGKYATTLKPTDYDDYDLFVCMDDANVRNATRILGGDPEGKVKKLLSFTGSSADVSDPYWTGDFVSVYDDINSGINALYDFLTKKS